MDSVKRESLIKAANELWHALDFKDKILGIDQIKGDLLYTDELGPEKLVKEYFPEMKSNEIQNYRAWALMPHRFTAGD